MKKEDLTSPDVLLELQKLTKKFEYAKEFHNIILVDAGDRSERQ